MPGTGSIAGRLMLRQQRQLLARAPAARSAASPVAILTGSPKAPSRASPKAEAASKARTCSRQAASCLSDLPAIFSGGGGAFLGAPSNTPIRRSAVSSENRARDRRGRLLDAPKASFEAVTSAMSLSVISSMLLHHPRDILDARDRRRC